jgi:acyl-CoA reductase-like NAD-dependent aldehyde dehydrogenase
LWQLIYRLSGRQRGLGRGRGHRGHALYEAKPILHSGIALVSACRYFHQLSRQITAPDGVAEARRPIGRGHRHRTIINEKQFRKVRAYIEEGLQRREGQLMFGGLPPKKGPLSEGYFAIPTVFADASNDWRLAREEIFGPVLVAIPGREEADAIRMDNDSHYGLAAYVLTHDIGSALRTAHVIESGWVQVDQGLGQNPAIPMAATSKAALDGSFTGGHAGQLHSAQKCHCKPQHPR